MALTLKSARVDLKNLDCHPLADLFPLMEGKAFDTLVDDIKQNGCHYPIILHEGKILDGRNRYLALLHLGKLPTYTLPYDGDDPLGFVLSSNLHRRHLTTEQKREVIARVLKAQPERSDRAIGKLAQADHKTVGTVRSELEGRGEIPHASEHIDSLGRQQPAHKPRPDPAAQRGQPNRDGPDFWPTPHSLITALVRFVLPELPSGPIWECACGDGRIAKAIAEAGREVVASDLYYYPQNGGSAPGDFLKDDHLVADAIVVTNPPFNQNEEFLQRGLELLDAGRIQGLVLLLRHDHLMASTRISAFNRAVREVHCNWRPIWIEDTEGNPRWSFHWFVWHGGPRQPPLYLSLTDVE